MADPNMRTTTIPSCGATSCGCCSGSNRPEPSRPSSTRGVQGSRSRREWSPTSSSIRKAMMMVPPVDRFEASSAMNTVKWNVLNWRGTVGVISPSVRVGAQDLANALPDGVGIITRALDARVGSSVEFRELLADIEHHIEQLVAAGVDVISQNGVPPMIVHGYEHERGLVAEWESRYGVPVITAVWSQVQAMRALGMRRFVGLTYLVPDMNDLASRYFTEAGFDVVAMAGIGSFGDAQHIPAAQIYAGAKELMLRHEGVDGIYLLGNAWDVAKAVEPLEQDLQVPVCGGRAPGSWAIQHQLRVRQPMVGMGRLLAEFPPLPG